MAGQDIASYRVKSNPPLQFEQVIEASSVFAGALALVNALERIMRTRAGSGTGHLSDPDWLLRQFQEYSTSQGRSDPTTLRP